MEYSIDLLKEKKKSIFILVLGILLLLLALAWIPIRWKGNGSVTFFDWIYFIAMLLSGFSQISQGLGYPIVRLFGKAYVEINNKIIRVKTGVLDKEQSVEWSDIDSINYKSGNFVITKKDNSIYNLSASKLEYIQIQEVKSVINNIANDKKISINLKNQF